MARVFFEMKRVGTVIRVSATDEETGIEAVIQGSAQASKKELEVIAMKKLHYLMEKKKNETQAVPASE